MRFICATPSTMLPASGTEPPERPLPIARGVSGTMRCERDTVDRATSAVVARQHHERRRVLEERAVEAIRDDVLGGGQHAAGDGGASASASVIGPGALRRARFTADISASGIAHELAGLRSVVRRHRDADADAEPDRRAGDDERGFDRRGEARCDRARFGEVGDAREDGRELVAADAREEVAGPDDPTQGVHRTR